MIVLSKNTKGNLLLILAAVLWGISFVMQDEAGAVLTPFAINGIRSIIGSLVLVPLILIFSKKNGRPFFEKTKKERKDILTAGVLCGVFLCIATNFQQFGINLYPEEAAASGRSGFITALYVVLVPVFGIFMKKRISFTVWIGVALAVIGMCLLCLSGGIGSIYIGDIIIICCAFAFTMQIICIDKYSDRVDGIKLSSMQFLVCGILSLILMFIFEEPTLNQIKQAMPYILYLGVVSCGMGYTLQIVGQQYSKNPTVASILMSLESVFAVISGAIILGERFTIRETVGCIIMFGAIVFAQLPPLNFKKKES